MHTIEVYDRYVVFRKYGTVEPFVDARRFREAQSKLKIQMRDAVWWKDVCLLYFQTFRMPVPAGIERPVHELEDMKRFRWKSRTMNVPRVGLINKLWFLTL